MREQGGLITEADLSGCDLPVIRDSISIPYRGHEVLSVPPPGGGLQLLLALRTLEHLDLPERPDPILWVGAIARITRSVFQERERWPIRPERLSPSFMRWLIGEERAKELATEILAGADHSNPPEAEGPGDTTHLCVADAAGMIVSLTQSVQSLFGAKVANRHLGFFYNNYLCTCPRYRHPSRLRGGAAPQSNVAPTIVLGRPIAGGAREPVLAIGAAGSRRITSSVLQVLANVLHRGMPLEEAMDAPRVHATTSGRVMIERTAAGREVQESLARGFRSIDVKAPRSYAMGGVQAIGRDADSRMWVGCADPRREGACDAI
jgi:gamma-glutamyltranspeptidase/glutathione hydrolase